MRKLIAAILLCATSAGADCLNLALGQNWTFYLQGSRFSTGAAYDATGSPAYRLYEEETGTPILTGSYALLDDAGSLGLYSEQIAATGANGFEAGKCYVIYSTATVDSVAAAKIDCACISYRTDTSGYIAASGGAAIDDNPWDAATRSLTILDEDSTTIDLDASTVGTVTTVTTATNLTNAPTAGDLTATMKASVTTAATASTPTINATQAFSNTGTWTGNIVGTLSTLTTYTGNTVQTGDSFARIGAAGAGLTALATQASVDAVDNYVDTEVAAILAALAGIVPASGTIGATGNDATHLHLDGLAYADDGINSMLLTIKDVSTGLFYSRWVEDFVTAGDLATVGTMPFTPEASVDLYWVLPTRADVTGGSGLDAAGVRAALGFASANADTQLAALQADLDLYDTDAEHAAPVWNAATATYGSAGSYGLLSETNLDGTITSRMATYTQPTGFLAATFPSAVSSLTQTQVTGGAYDLGSASAVLGDARIANLDATVSSRGTSTLTQTQVTGGAYSMASASQVLGDTRIANLDAAVSSRGTGAALDAAGVRSAVGMATNNLDTQIATLATAAALTTVDDFVDTEVAAIKAKTDNLPADPADASDIATAHALLATAAALTTVDDYVDTEVAAIQAVATKLDTALELDGAVYRYTTNALEQGPSGSGLDAAATRAALGMASANLDTQLSGIQDDTNLFDTVGEHRVAVWEALTADYGGVGSYGAATEAAGGAADPLLNPVPGAYAVGTGGYNLGLIDDVKRKTDLLSSGVPVTVVNPVTVTGKMSLVPGDTYLIADGIGRYFSFKSKAWPDLSGATVTLKIMFGVKILVDRSATVSGAGDVEQEIQGELTSVESAKFKFGSNLYEFEYKATLASGSIVRLVAGKVDVLGP